MEPVILKKSRDGEENTNIGCLYIIVIPVIWAIYEIVTAKNSFEVWFFSGFIVVLFLVPIEYFLVSRLPLSPSIIITKQGMSLFWNIKRYSGIGWVRKFYPIEEELIPWDDIMYFKLVTRYEERSSGNEGGTVTIRIDTLIMVGATGKKDRYCSVGDLTLAPKQILALCEAFHKEYKSLEKRSIIS